MTLQEAIEIIEHQKKYITGNPILVEAYNVIINEAKPMTPCDVCCMKENLFAKEECFESAYGNMYTAGCHSAKLKLFVVAESKDIAIEAFKNQRKGWNKNNE